MLSRPKTPCFIIQTKLPSWTLSGATHVEHCVPTFKKRVESTKFTNVVLLVSTMGGGTVDVDSTCPVLSVMEHIQVSLFQERILTVVQNLGGMTKLFCLFRTQNQHVVALGAVLKMILTVPLTARTVSSAKLKFCVRTL